LLAELKRCSPSTGEELLRRFVALQVGEKKASPHPSELNKGNLSDGMGQSIEKSCMAERIQWCPAFHPRSRGHTSKEQLQVRLHSFVLHPKSIEPVSFAVCVQSPQVINNFY
jgi:hypothetical protein